ncbi:GNAT family N-acetyltransferase [Pullulanibacillus sp. KACC 23026]|uniref:GNAT family N-acetyltransferase n=1 Tax=Pullulanibacillus sp. KACC 23026 TaxID=3028315 RepID=UPI0023AF18F1|nr:GNAT family N-acetyltransferase [Pullulanibacillus sp. KACC 23026]WEG14413.1 GNAT family N-acetyltransferase [Pullulanibacillus sp. KACC 23026]
MPVAAIHEGIRGLVGRFFEEHWGSPEMVISSGVFDCSQLDGYVWLNEAEEIVGLITYQIRGEELEIISLDSIEEGKGVGTALLKEVEKKARYSHCLRITLITTNDNLSALRFYQKRGYVLSQLLTNAVSKARERKPEIPLIGKDGIPIRDELRLEKFL